LEELIHTHGVHRHKISENERQIEKDLETLMWRYDYMEENMPEGIGRRAKEEMERVLKAMLDDNLAEANDLNERAKKMRVQCEIFKKSNKRLKKRIMGRNIKTSALIGGGVGAAAGGAIGFMIGGPGGAALLATEGAEIGAGVALGVLGGSALFASTTACSQFWKTTKMRVIRGALF